MSFTWNGIKTWAKNTFGADTTVDLFVTGGGAVAGSVTGSKIGNAMGSYLPVAGNFVGTCVGFGLGVLHYVIFDTPYIKGKTLREIIKGDKWL